MKAGLLWVMASTQWSCKPLADAGIKAIPAYLQVSFLRSVHHADQKRRAVITSKIHFIRFSINQCQDLVDLGDMIRLACPQCLEETRLRHTGSSSSTWGRLSSTGTPSSIPWDR